MMVAAAGGVRVLTSSNKEFPQPDQATSAFASTLRRLLGQ